jgi:hypothetical protein
MLKGMRAASFKERLFYHRSESVSTHAVTCCDPSRWRVCAGGEIPIKYIHFGNLAAPTV